MDNTTCPTSVADLESHIEELTQQNKSLIHAIFVQQRDQKRQDKAVKDIVEFLEYEEGLTKDPATQKRITKLLKKHKVWS